MREDHFGIPATSDAAQVELLSSHWRCTQTTAPISISTAMRVTTSAQEPASSPSPPPSPNKEGVKMWRCDSLDIVIRIRAWILDFYHIFCKLSLYEFAVQFQSVVFLVTPHSFAARQLANGLRSGERAGRFCLQTAFCSGFGWLLMASAFFNCQHGQETLIAEAGIFPLGKGSEGCKVNFHLFSSWEFLSFK